MRHHRDATIGAAEDADSGISNGPVATRGPATRHSFRSGDRIGPRAAAATYIIILIMIIILEIGAPHDARGDGVARPIARDPLKTII